MADTPNLPLVQSYHPATFLERGVLVPFTTPLLSGTRARPAARGGAELIVPNPSGARGVYVLPWSGVRELCRPTVHDVRLNDKVTALRSVTPSAIRDCGRQVALEGFAGRDAGKAAHDACERQKSDRVLTNFLLVMNLVQQVEPSDRLTAPLAGEREGGLEMRAKRALLTVGPRMNRPPEAIANSLEELAGVFEDVGVGAQSATARLSCAIDALARMSAETLAWSRQFGGETGAWAAMVADVAELTLSCARRTLQEAVALTASVPDLLRRWENDPEPVSQLAARPEWLLDGWQQINLLWRDAANDAERRTAIPEMAELMPVLPKETGDWIGAALEEKAATRFRKLVARNEDWRTGGKVLDLIERNERLRALAA